MSAAVRCAVSVEVANITLLERRALNEMIGLLSDPARDHEREEFFRGERCLVIKDGMVTLAEAPISEPMFAEVMR